MPPEERNLPATASRSVNAGSVSPGSARLCGLCLEREYIESLHTHFNQGRSERSQLDATRTGERLSCLALSDPLEAKVVTGRKVPAPQGATVNARVPASRPTGRGVFPRSRADGSQENPAPGGPYHGKVRCGGLVAPPFPGQDCPSRPSAWSSMASTNTGDAAAIGTPSPRDKQPW